MSDINYRPRIQTPNEIPTIWVDQTTGQGVNQDGISVKPRVGDRRKSPNLTDLLETAASYGAGRIMLTGKRPEPAPGIRHWLFVKTPGWRAGDHWVNSGPPTGRFEHAVTGQKVEVRTVEEWFGDLSLSPAQARDAWRKTAEVLKSVDERARMFLTPARTGTNLWALSLPRNVNPVPVMDDIAEQLHLTSGQHHQEHLVAGANHSSHPDTVPLVDASAIPKIKQFAYIDGRFMYAAMGRELGIGPGFRMNALRAYEMLNDPKGRYARARYRVKFAVPDDWNHVGILGVRHPEISDGWYFPNRPGAVGETWVDASELDVAMRHGWSISVIEAILFPTAKPLDTFTERLTRARERVAEDDELPVPLRKAVEAALRMIVLQAIGAFASRGRESTRVATSALEVPAEYQRTMQRQGELFIYRIPSANTGWREFYHPELAAQVWGRARARVLDGPSGLGHHTSGALTVDPSTLLGINGDAIYTTELPRWSLPEAHGGGDDGRVGRLRLQGYLEGSFQTPVSLEQRDSLKRRAERAGISDAISMEAAS